MSNVYSMPFEESRYNEASLWIERLDEGLTEGENRELAEWMAADPENRAVLFRMAKLWDRMDTLSRLSTLFPEPSAPALRQVRLRYAVAASVVTAVAAASLSFLLQDVPFTADDGVSAELSGESMYETAVGEHATVELTDGTEVALNTDSRLRVQYGSDYRVLILESGELHVDVAHDAERPLSVIAGDRVVQAVGTAFNVEITDRRRVELVVTDGEVRVGVRAPASSRESDLRPPVLPPSSTTVAAGEELLLGAAEETVTPVSDEEIAVRLSWRNGSLIFRGESLAETVAEVGRYTAVEFVIVDEALKTVRVSGVFKSGDVDGMLAVLRENFDIAYERVDENRILLTAL